MSDTLGQKRIGRSVAYSQKKAIASFKRASGKLIRFNGRRLRFLVKHLEMIILALFLGVVFLFFELMLRMYDLYRVAYWVDVPSHFFGGMALAGLALMFLYLTRWKYKDLYAVFFVFLAAWVWEFLEYIGDWLIPQPYYLLDFFFWDGFWDIIITTVGAIAFVVVFNKYIKRRLGKSLITYI